MKWLNQIENTQIIDNFFDGVRPDISSVIIHKVILERDGPCILIVFDVYMDEDLIPTKWLEKEMKVIQYECRFIATENVVLNGWACETSAVFRVETKSDKSIEVNLNGDNISLSFRCSHIYVNSVKAYCEN